MSSKVITIDGPAAAGKTTLAGRLAKTLTVGVLNTGALYRAATWVMRLKKLQEASSKEICEALKEARLRYEESFEGSRLWAFDQEITQDLRDPDLTREIKFVANLPEARQWMNIWQREICANEWRVTEGRDQGTEVFPEARVKIFLTADLDVRFERRCLQLAAEGRKFERDVLYKDMQERDESDQKRPVGALRPAEDAFILESSQMNFDEVIEASLHWIKKQLENQEDGLPVALP